MSIHIHSDEEYKKLRSEMKGISFVKCSASWCGPCKTIAPIYNKLAENSEFVFLSLDIDDCEETSKQLKIRALPTFVVLKDGKEVQRLVGANKDKLFELVDIYM